MIAISETLPEVHVAAAEYRRLLGYPRDHTVEGRALELAEWAREWYARHGRPWMFVREAGAVEVVGDGISIEGETFHSGRLAGTLRWGGAHGAALVAVGAGAAIEAEAQKLWAEEKPDEYFFLEVYGSAVVEHLTTLAGARLCGWGEANGMAVLPHYSPGYPEWDIGEQGRLLRLFGEGLPERLTALDSGMLRPKKSLLGVFGLTRSLERVRRITELVPCENCSFSPCQFRRSPYRREQRLPALRQDATYATNRKALRRWAAERLQLQSRDDGGFDAVFRFDGTTCNNTGRPFAFDYGVRLGSREDGYTIQDESCRPVTGDVGHRSMCGYGEPMMTSIAKERPLLGRRLDEVLEWKRPVCSAGCYCDPEAREHKWGLVLETIHHALAEREENER